MTAITGRRLSLCIFLGGLTVFASAVAAAPKCKVPRVKRNQVVVPTLEIVVERVDPARYPLIDVYFRVQDTNGTTQLRLPKFRDIAGISDGPAGGALEGRTVIPPPGDGDPKDKLLEPAVVRPLAVAFSIDRSGSVGPVLENIKEAIASYVNGNMNRDRAKHVPPWPDVMYSIAHSGKPKNLETALRTGPPPGAPNPLGFVEDPVVLQKYLDLLIAPGYKVLGSPIYRGWDAAEAEIAAHPYEYPEAARCLISITDGYNNVKPGSPCALLAAVQNFRVPNFVMGFVRIGKTRVAASSVKRPVLVHAARISDGAYFEPQPPIPRALPPPDLSSTNEEKSDYVMEGLELLAEIYENGGDDDGGAVPDFAAAIAGPAAKVLTAAPTTPAALVTALNGDDGPDTTDLAAQTWGNDELKAFRKAVNRDRADEAKEFTKADLFEFYNVQVAQFVKKIHQSLKYVYRASYRVEQPLPFDASERDVKLAVAYPTEVSFPVVKKLDLASAGLGAYRVPRVIPENAPRTISLAVDRPTTDVAAVLANDNPRGGTWDAAPTVSLDVSLWMETKEPDAANPTVVKLATRRIEAEGAGDVALTGGNDFGVLAPAADGLPAEADTYLRALQAANPAVAVAGGKATVTFDVQPLLPTAPKNPDGLRPLANETEPKRSRLLWYTVDPYISRGYTLTVKQLAGGVKAPAPTRDNANTVYIPPGTTATPPVDGTVLAGSALDGTVLVRRRVPLPPAVLYVSDQTPPSLAAFLSSDESGTCLIEQREEAVDAVPYAKRWYLTGPAFAGDPKGTTTPDHEAPRMIDDLNATGFIVTQGVPVRLAIAAKDDFDRNHRHEYFLPQAPGAPPALPSHNAFRLDLAGAQELKDFQPPYLAKQAEDAMFPADDKPKAAGIAWRFEDGAGRGEDALADARTFRQPNQRVNPDGTLAPDGDPVFLHVRAMDASGNVADMKLPILVVPTGIKLDQLRFSAERR